MNRPQKAQQMTTPILLEVPTGSSRINGVLVKEYAVKGTPFACNLSTYGGTETEKNGVLSIEDTATITTWYNPDIVAGCKIKRLTDGAEFEVIGTPENIEMRNMLSVFKVRRVGGGA